MQLLLGCLITKDILIYTYDSCSAIIPNQSRLWLYHG